MAYRAPVGDIAFSLKHAAGLKQALADGLYGDLGEDDIDAILEEAGKFATNVIGPLNAVGDKHGTPFKDGVVTTPPGLERGLSRLGRRRLERTCRARPNGAARICRSRSMRRAMRCGMPARWLSSSARC